jgi:HEAT repeat protein
LDKIKKYIQDLQESSSTAKRLAAYKLGIFGDMGALEPLVKALEDHNPFVRSNVAEALGNLGSVKAIEHLIKYIDDMDFTVRCSVIEAIGNIAQLNRDVNKNVFSEIVLKLIEVLDDDKYLIRHYASDTLSKIAGEQVDKLIASTLINGSDVAVEFAIWTVGKLGDNSYEEQLIDIFEKTENINIKRAVISTLYQLESDIEALLRFKGYNIEEVKKELFNEELFNDRLFYNL